jgi:hypothetical protein
MRENNRIAPLFRREDNRIATRLAGYWDTRSLVIPLPMGQRLSQLRDFEVSGVRSSSS